MEDILKILKQLVSSVSFLGDVPKPVRASIAVFSGIVGFGLIFVYAHPDRNQKILLAIAIGVIAVVTGGYYAWKTWLRKEQDQPFDLEVPQDRSSPAASAELSRAQPNVPPDGPERENFWDSPPRGRVAPISRPAQPVTRAVGGHSPAMTLIELTEPLFQYICRLNRIARRGPGGKLGDTTTFLTKTAAGPAAAARGAALDDVVARSEIKALLEDIISKAATDLRLSQQARKIELPLVFFVDSMISESTLPFAAQWNQNRLAYDRQELAGDEKFFDLLDETLKESGEDAAERLAIFYICIGLGFTGIYFKQPELLRKIMLSIAPRIRHLVENDQTARICPEAYQGVDTRNLVEPPTSRMVLVGLVFGCFTFAVLISYFIMYRQASRNLNESIEEVLRQDLAVARSN